MKKLILVLSLSLLAACTNPSASREALSKAGFSDITIGGYDTWSCGKDDPYATHFRAKNPLSKYVEGTVCCGVLKSCTVRF